MKLRSVRSAKVHGRRVLVRAELNVADRAGRTADDVRIRAAVPTLRLLLARGARVIIVTHRGRPQGRVVQRLSTKPLARPLSRLLGVPVKTVNDCVGPIVERAVMRLANGQALLLENVRFHPGEERNDRRFSRQLAKLADLFVLEAFGTAHRAHAAVVGVGQWVPSFAGLRFIEEVRILSRVLHQPRRPLVFVIGGAKISSKLNLIERLLGRADGLLLGGALANTILQAQGLNIGQSLSEPKMVRAVRRLQLTKRQLHVPVDLVVRQANGRRAVRAVGDVGRRESILDIGPDTVTLFTTVLRRARTIIWNGPMGRYEEPPFDRGTRAVARAVARSRAYTVVGGGETVDAVRSQGLARAIDFISTGGGAMVEFLEGRRLPGVELVRELDDDQAND
ncbi:MAG: phosphoglycerate kinase [Candidatus Kerfeldbacteria bacterium]|nr:phosphoglycerate kinase [Candidatus Kerfeldbacteria bacterium]